jgi:hypothetical protein
MEVKKMTYQELKIHLAGTGLFSGAEIDKIVHTCKTYTLGNAVIACEVIGITLCGNAVDIIFHKKLDK